MAGTNLFPAIALPGIPDRTAGERYRPSVLFDFDRGDFVLDSAGRLVEARGREAYAQWCSKAVQTERGAFRAYSQRYGVEAEGLYRAGSPEAWKGDAKKAITEALMANPATEHVGGFEFEESADECLVSFRAKGRGLAEEELSIARQTG